MLKRIKKLLGISKEEQTLEQEFFARQFQHKYSVLGAYLMLEYMEKERNKKGATIPEFLLEIEADKYSSKKIREYMLNGEFDKQYNIAFEKVGHNLPNNFNGNNLK